MTRDELDEAIEQAAFVPGALRSTVIATEFQVDRLRDQLRRLLGELDDGATVLELRELLEPDAGDPD